MNLCLSEFKWIAVLFSNSIGHVKNTSLGFKCQSETNAQINIIDRITRHIIFCPSPIDKTKKKRIHTNQITILQTANCIFGSQNTFFIKTS